MQERNIYVSQKHNGMGNNELTLKDNEFNNFELKQVTQHVIELAPESPRVHRRPVCLSQATLPDSFKLS